MRFRFALLIAPYDAALIAPYDARVPHRAPRAFRNSQNYV
jgi:hypothetical protein